MQIRLVAAEVSTGFCCELALSFFLRYLVLSSSLECLGVWWWWWWWHCLVGEISSGVVFAAALLRLVKRQTFLTRLWRCLVGEMSSCVVFATALCYAWPSAMLRVIHVLSVLCEEYGRNIRP